MEAKQAQMNDFVAELTNQLEAQRKLVAGFAESQNEALNEHTQQAENLVTKQHEFHQVCKPP